MQALLDALGIQWSMLLAQAINFGILLYILQRFAYKPVLDMIDSRRKTLQESERKVQEVDRLYEEVERVRTERLRTADEEAGKLLETAKKQAETTRTEIETAAKTHADQILNKGMKQLETERAHVLADVQEKLASIIVHSTEKILRREFSPKDQAALMEEIKKNLPSALA
jgi:F-type H+-transporting ATPase subunit b